MKKLLALLMALCMVFALCACGNDSNTNTNIEQNKTSSTEDTSSEETTTKFEVTVVDQNGDAVSGVMVQVCKDTCLPAMTDSNGVATFSLEITDESKLSVMSCPEGYESENTGDNYIYLEDDMTEYTLTITKVGE